MAEEVAGTVLKLNHDEAKRLKIGLEKCFEHEPLFDEKELEGLERAYDLLMGLK